MKRQTSAVGSAYEGTAPTQFCSFPDEREAANDQHPRLPWPPAEVLREARGDYLATRGSNNVFDKRASETSLTRILFVRFRYLDGRGMSIKNRPLSRPQPIGLVRRRGPVLRVPSVVYPDACPADGPSPVRSRGDAVRSVIITLGSPKFGAGPSQCWLLADRRFRGGSAPQGDRQPIYEIFSSHAKPPLDQEFVSGVRYFGDSGGACRISTGFQRIRLDGPRGAFRHDLNNWFPVEGTRSVLRGPPSKAQLRHLPSLQYLPTKTCARRR